MIPIIFQDRDQLINFLAATFDGMVNIGLAIDEKVDDPLVLQDLVQE